jgi:IMP dehydrogenase
MAKDINLNPGRTFSEFSLLPSLTPKDCTVQNVDLETNLSTLSLRIPFLSAAMTSVTGYDMALALGKEGGIGVLPTRIPTKEQAEIVNRIKSYEMGFVEEPITANDADSIEAVLRLVESHGHSKVPVVDRNNVFQGLFTQQHYWSSSANSQDPVTSAMISLEDITVHNNPKITVTEAKKIISSNGQNHLVVLDDQNRLVKLAFQKDVEKIKVASAISTYPGWKRRVDANIEAGVDLIVIDTSDAYNEFTQKVLQDYRKMETGTPICAGNVVTYDGALFLMEHGADIVKVGMSSGSICTTHREKAVGRAPMTALIEASRAQETFIDRHVPLIMDGGISTAADMIIALSLADAVMMGHYFNRFHEAEGEKYDKAGKETRVESEIRTVATWGEGSAKAQNLERYGHSNRKTFFEEGVEGTAPYEGRLKPYVKKDLSKVRAALSNAGCFDLESFRREASLELISPHSSYIITHPRDIKEKV